MMRKTAFQKIILPAVIIIAGFGAVFALSGFVERSRPPLPESFADSDLCLKGARLKGFAFGMEGLVADWYWMRSLQYIGDKVLASKSGNINIDDLRDLNPRLLYPYLENATDLEEQWTRAPESTTDPLREFQELSRKTFGSLNDPGEQAHTLLMVEHLVTGIRQGGADLAGQREGFAKTREGIGQRLALAKENGQLPRGLDPELVAGALFSFYLGARISKAVDSAVDTDGQFEQIMGLLRAISSAVPV